MATTQTDVETEMMFTSWAGSCKDPHLTSGGDLRECRRPTHHHGAHASGFGATHHHWDNQTNTHAAAGETT